MWDSLHTHTHHIINQIGVSQIWYNRNQYVHEGEKLAAGQVWQLATCTLEDFRKANFLALTPPSHPSSRWETPPRGVFKINANGATSNLGKNSSIGVIIRDCNGHVVAALYKYLQGRFAADQVEALAVEQGVLLAQELQLSRVIVESDALAVIQAINDNTTGSDLGHILQGVLLVCESFESCNFKHLSRDFNAVAHELAQLARRSETSYKWNGVTPAEVSRLVQKDLLALV